MKISVFTPNHNNSGYLKQSIESVLNQSHIDFEYLIYDDGSTDNSVDVIREYTDDRIKFFELDKQENVGVVINKSFDESEGDYWCWCPSDDYFHLDLLKEKIDYIDKYPKSILYNDWYIINETGKVLREHIVNEMTSDEFSKEVWKTSPIGFSGIFIPKYIYKNLRFPEHLKYSEDFYWMIKATIHGYPFNRVPLKLHYKRKHNNSLSTKNRNQIVGNILNIRKELLEYKTNIKTVT